MLACRIRKEHRSLKPILSVIRTKEGIDKLRQYLQQFEYVAFDCETTGLDKSCEVIGFSVCAEEDKAFYVVLSDWCKDKQHLLANNLYVLKLITHIPFHT